MAVTLQNLTDLWYDILSSEEDVSSYPLTFMQQLMNSAQYRICNGTVSNPITKEIVTKWVLPFLNTDKYYSNVWSTSLSADTSVWATTLTVSSTTDFSSTGALYIQGNIITYTGKTSTTFTWCSNVLFAFLSGTQVSVAFALPTWYGTPLNMIYNHSKQIDFIEYDRMFEEFNADKWYWFARNSSDQWFTNYTTRVFYTIKDRAYIIVLGLDTTGQQFRFRYEALPDEMTATTDNASIDIDVYAKSTIPYLAIWELLYNRWEEKRAWEMLNYAIGQIREMYSFYGNSWAETQSGKRVKSDKYRLNI